MHKADCIFCQIVEGRAPSHQVWEDEEHLAFLSIFPNTEAFTVVIPKEHYDSYAFAAPEKVLLELVGAARKTALLLDKALPNVGRTGLIFEGFGVDHLHAKLVPMHGTGEMKDWHPIKSPINTYFEQYPGYISSHDSERADDTVLAALAEKIRNAGN